MSTFRLPILAWSTLPDSNASTYFEPSNLNFGTNGLYPHLLLSFNDQANREGISGSFVVPQNYVGSAKIVPVWATTATSGVVVWDFDYTAVGGDSAESLDPAANQEAVTGSDTASGTSRRRQELSISLTSANLAAGDTVLFNFYRDGADAADTLAASAFLFELFFEYADA